MMKARLAVVVLGGAIVVGLIVGTLTQLPRSKTIAVGSLILVVDTTARAADHVDEAGAVRTTLAAMATQDAANGGTVVKGYVLRHSYYAPGLLKASTASGVVFSTFSRPRDVWVLEFSAPAQAGWRHVSAVAVVDGPTGQLIQFSEDKHS